MIWEDISNLWLLLFIPLLIAGSWYLGKYYQQKRQVYFSEKLFSKLSNKASEKTKLAKSVLIITSLSFFIIALAGPKIGTEIREVERDGVDLIIALDVSRSMLALDVRPNRLEKAKFEILRLLERLGGDRVGLVVFTSSAYFQVPLTNDYGAYRMFLDLAHPDMISAQGTNFRNVLRVSHEAFMEVRERGSNAGQVLLIMSDGEDHGPDFTNILNQFAEDNIFIYSVGIGTVDGSNIPVYDPDTGDHIDMHRDRSGRVVTTRLEPENLQRLSNATGGEYYEIRRASQGLDGFLNQLAQLEHSTFATEELVDYKNQYQVIAGLGLFMLIIALILPAYKEPEE